MAGGNITRLVGGKNQIDCETWTVFTNEFRAYAGSGSHFTADGGTFIGNPKEAPAFWKYFKKGWWSSDKEGIKKIKLAELDDTVYFQIELTNEFPSKNKNLTEDNRRKIKFKVYRFDGYERIIYGTYPIYTYVDALKREKEQKIGLFTWKDINDDGAVDDNEKDTVKDYNEIEAIGKKATLGFHLNESLKNLFLNNYDFELFVEVSYENELAILPEVEDYLSVTLKVKEIYVKLLNYQVSPKVTLALGEIQANQQYIRGNDDKQSEKVNMDYFSVRIKKLPHLLGGIKNLYQFLMQNFITLASGTQYFKGHGPVPRSIDRLSTVNGKWKFIPYSKDDDVKYANEQLRKWDNKENHPIFYIEADSDDFPANQIVDNGAVIVSEFSDMCWLFTTINTEKSRSQPFSGHRQFGIHLDEDGYYRVFARAIDRVWPSDRTKNANLRDMDATVKDYLAIADGTWMWYMDVIFRWITKLGGEAKIMKPEIMRTDFHKFLSKYHDKAVTDVGNIPQQNYYEK